jgi:hypothetical protein
VIQQQSEPRSVGFGASTPAAIARPSRRGLRFSLLTLVWLLTVVACGVGIWQTGKQIVPLREEVARVRKELGYFPIDDPAKIQIRRVKNKVPNAWQWRLYLPTWRTYTLCSFHGRAPDPATMPRDKWTAVLRAASRPQAVVSTQPIGNGESSFEALLTKYGGQWWLRMGALNEDGQSISIAPRDEWLNDETTWVVDSDVSYLRPTSFDATTPVVLLHVEKSVHGPDDGGPVDPEPADASGLGNRLVIWIESS